MPIRISLRSNRRLGAKVLVGLVMVPKPGLSIAWRGVVRKAIEIAADYGRRLTSGTSRLPLLSSWIVLPYRQLCDWVIYPNRRIYSLFEQWGGLNY